MQLSNTTFLPNNVCVLLLLKKKHETRLKNLCCTPLKKVVSHVTSSVTYATFLEVPPLLRRKILGLVLFARWSVIKEWSVLYPGKISAFVIAELRLLLVKKKSKRQ